MLNKISFFLIFIFMSIFILLNLEKINSDIYSLIGFKNEEKEILENLNKKLASEIVIVSNNKKEFEKFIELSQKSKLFSELFYHLNSLNSYQEELNKYKLALLDEESFNLLKNNPSAFFQRSSNDFFNKFKPLSSSQDFFSLSLHSSLLDKQSKIKFDISENRFRTELEDKRYYFAKGTLAKNYNGKELLKLVKLAKQKEILISGASIYSALGKKSAEFETLFMGGFSFLLSALLLFSAFKNLKIFYLASVVIFGLTSGLFSLFLFYDTVHSISIIISTSLIGLMLDFSVHWLGANSNSILHKNSIKKMQRIFLLGFFITAGGYSIFLLSPFFLLSQIAIFAIFALLGAFLFSYLVLPEFLNNCRFQSSVFWNKYLDFSLKYVAKLNFLQPKIICSLLLISSLFLYNFANFKDDIREYSNLDKELLIMSQKISQMTGDSYDLVLLKKENSNLLKNLVKDNLIEDYLSIDKFILSKQQQEEITRLFSKTKPDLMTGINQNLVKKELEKIANSKVYEREEVLTSPIFFALKNLELNGKNLAFLYNIKDKNKLKEIINSEGGTFLSFTDSANSLFSDIKINAIYLKLLAYGIAFSFLAIVFGIKKGLEIVFLVLLSNLLSLTFLFVCGFSINIFAIFGLILAGAIGIDYMIFALNKNLELRKKFFGINLAVFTSMISFLSLSFSATVAVSVFGLSVAINILICAIFAQIYAYYLFEH